MAIYSQCFPRFCFHQMMFSRPPKTPFILKHSLSSSPHLNQSPHPPQFGIMFDIDGVIVRGKKVLPFSPGAFQRLVDSQGRFRVPTVFVTNAGNSLRQTKADQLSDWLNVQVTEDQVVMSHSPLKMFTKYHNRHVLVTGQGPVAEIAANLGFTNITTISQLRHAFPSLDVVDHKRRRTAPCSFETYFPRIEAVVLFGEPIRWETPLQLLIDVLTTQGLPCQAPKTVPYPHIPILACNMDLQWMAEAVLPRFGHGAFLTCLENLYQKITGHDLVYSALIGKPSEITYRHSEHMLQAAAKKIGLDQPVQSIYCIGDNVCTDIFGANLYHKQLSKLASEEVSTHQTPLAASRSFEHLMGPDESKFKPEAKRCYSILVETGVYSFEDRASLNWNHSPRDFLPVEEKLLEPSFLVPNVSDAVDLILQREDFH
ncbi:hypothetical protein TCAL_00409 [Tigriopus californicus]|uniref:Haloacid dehalogenase-like hydrolase domain-containing 5 n=1 Tax=Tigriopus californicus TaxID=6832 RepID=A0A553NDI2_TIGCA|nr:haloacid dehalogenase-like hydrolase domain-containing 5 [Tigriopus californicus]TRY63500.1 hypothetical protein TCAL_00409 [Tigriopus californicus]